MELAVLQYDRNDRCFSKDLIPFQNVLNPSIPADIFAKFRVNSDTEYIILELYKERWNIAGKGFICWLGVPYCRADFFYHYRTKPYIYLLVSFCGRRLVFDFLKGDHHSRLLRKKTYIKVDDDDQPCRVFSREDMPDEARHLCDFVPLDGIDVW